MSDAGALGGARLPRRTGSRSVLACLFATAAVLIAGAASAHPLAPLGLEVRELAAGRWEVRLKRPLVQPRGAAFAPRWPEACSPVGPRALSATDDAVVETWALDCRGRPLEGASIGVDGLAEAELDGVVRVTFTSGRVHRALLTPRAPRFTIPAEPRPMELARAYFWRGVEHLLTGFDHLLFLLGLLFVPSARKRLVAVLTAFTAGHAITLCLAVLGRVSLPMAAVEVAIAANLVFLGLQILHARSAERLRISWLTAGAFGLLHGLGFAGALASAGLAPTDAPLALASFHFGLELCQLAVVGVALALGRLGAAFVFPSRVLRRGLPGYVVGSLAAMWLCERLWQAATGLRI